MSEWMSLYLINGSVTVKKFKEVRIGNRDVTNLIDSFEMIKGPDDENYKILGYKEGKPVTMISDQETITNIGYCVDHFLNEDKNLYYKITTESNIKEETCNLESISVACEICNSGIFPEPAAYCDHVVFVYVEDYEGLWAYLNEEASKYINEKNDIFHNKLILKLCKEKNWKLTKYINDTESTYGRPKICICTNKK